MLTYIFINIINHYQRKFRQNQGILMAGMSSHYDFTLHYTNEAWDFTMKKS